MTLRLGTPTETFRFPSGYELDVKREDLSTPFPGPPFSKTRGVLAHLAARPERTIGVLDTRHSKAGWAVAYAATLLPESRHIINFYPRFRADPEGYLRDPQVASSALGATLTPLPAGRSAILYHAARRLLPREGYLMPNALKLPETVSETASEVARTATSEYDWIAVAISSGTIAAGVIRGLAEKGERIPLLLHAGYSRSEAAVSAYLEKASGVAGWPIVYIDEGWAYSDALEPPEWWPYPSSPFYDGKLVRYLSKAEPKGRGLLWNIG